MTGPTTYTPVLRWKPAEQGALGSLSRDQRAKIKPLLEIMPPRSKKVRLSTFISRSVVGAWGARRDFYLDVARLDGVAGVGEVIDAIGRLREAGAFVHVVTPLQRSAFCDELRAWCRAHEECPIGLRVGNADLVSITLRRDIGRALEAIRRNSASVDVLLDFGSMTDGTSMQRTAELIAKSFSWSSATLIGGSFPPDLSGLAKNQQHLLPRSEWLAWESLERRAIAADSAFGDYTVVSADFREPPSNANFSASIRYTSKRDFVVMRGEGVFNDEGEGFRQYPAQAQMLSARLEYCGPNFSSGDRYIYEMGSQQIKTGSAQTWLRASVNHHLVYVPGQLAA